MKTIQIYLILIISLVSNANHAQNTPTIIKKNSSNNCMMRYYYYPNMQAYYDQLEKTFIFQEDKKWIKAETLPDLYGGYSVYKHVRVLIKDFDEENPQTQLMVHKKEYPYCANGRFTYPLASN